MTKINVFDLHEQLKAAGIPIEGVALDRPNQPGISIDFHVDATDEQKAAAAQIIKDYDQDAVDAQKPKPVTEEDINSAKTVSELKALMLRQYQLKG